MSNTWEVVLKETIDELVIVRDNLTSAQTRCGVLVEECRTLKREKAKLYEVITRLTNELPARELNDVPRFIRDEHDLEDEQRPSGTPKELNERGIGYVPMPDENRVRNGLT